MKKILEQNYIRLLICIFVIFSCVTYVVNANRGIYADDDNLWFYSVSYKIFDPTGFEAVEDDISKAFAQDQTSDEMISRLNDKREYTYNYFFSSAFWALGRGIVSSVSAADTPYYKLVSDSIVYGFALASLVTLIIFTAIVLRQKMTGRFWYALACFAAFSALTSVLMTPKPPPFMVTDYPLIKMGISFLWFLTDPSFSFSAFSFTGRNNYILFALAFFLVRWRGNFQLFYILCALSLTMHASMAVLGLFIFIVIDALLRPSVFKNKTVLISITGAIIYYLLVESLWKKVGFMAVGLLIPVVGLVVFGTIQDKVLKFFPKLQKFVTQTQARAQDNIMGWDILIFLTFWTISLIPTVVISHFVDRMQYIYFWSQLHTRVLAIWQPGLVFAFFYWFIGNNKQDVCREFAALTLAGALVIGAISNLYLEKQLRPYPIKMPETMRVVDAVATGKARIATLGASDLYNRCYFPEGLVWYVGIQEYIARNEGTGETPLASYLQRKPKGYSLDCTKR